MDFKDTPGQAEFRKQAREWLDANTSTDFDVRQCNYNHDLQPFKAWQAKKAAGGWSCIPWPEAFGGRDGTAIEQVIWAQEEGELSRLSEPFIIGQGMAGATLMMHASEDIQERFLKKMATGEEIWCQLFTEPGAGSDLAGIRTTAKRDGDDWVINGQKVWTSYAHIADFGILLARTDSTVPKHQGMTYFIIDMKDPGVEVRPIRMIAGHSDFNEVFLTDVRIPDTYRVGAEGNGWRVALTTLMNERLSVGTAYPDYFDELFSLAQTLRDEHGHLVEQSDIRQRLAEWYVVSNGIKYLSYRMISQLSKGGQPGPESSVSKLVLGKGRQQVARLALDMMEQFGIIHEPDSEPVAALMQRLYMQAPAGRIAGGTDEILLSIIGERVLGLPAEPRVDKTQPFNAEQQEG